MIAATAFLWLAGAEVAHATDAPSTVLGAGKAGCGAWSETRRARDPANEAAVISWMHGYITAINEGAASGAGNAENLLNSTPETAAAVDADLWTFIDSYCAEHPGEDLHAAAAALVEGLRAREGSAP